MYYLRSDRLALKEYEGFLNDKSLKNIAPLKIPESHFVLSDRPYDKFEFDPSKKPKTYPLPDPITAYHNGQIIKVYKSPTGNTILTVVGIHNLANNVLELYGRNGEVWYLNMKFMVG